jgi:hypothetical protein
MPHVPSDIEHPMAFPADIHQLFAAQKPAQGSRNSLILRLLLSIRQKNLILSK